MSRTAAPQKPAETPDAPAQPNGQAPPESPPADEWAALAAPVVMPDRVPFAGISVNVVQSVPEPIRQRAEESLSENTRRAALKPVKDGKRSRVEYLWAVQPVPSVEMGVKFSGLMVKYAKYRPVEGDIPHRDVNTLAGQITCRHGEPQFYVTLPDGTTDQCAAGTAGAFLGVRYSVRPFEARKTTARLPGTE